jgi:surfactin synthase thioesterase subunit
MYSVKPIVATISLFGQCGLNMRVVLPGPMQADDDVRRTERAVRRVCRRRLEQGEVVRMVRATSAAGRWFPDQGAGVDGGMLLFCLPYAGGSASAFREWPALLPEHLHCVPVRLPGRETRLAEPPVIDVVELSRAISGYASGRPYAIFGHSMGARLTFEVTRQLRRDGAPLPAALLVSGCRPPHLDTPLSRIARLPDDEFCARLQAMGGTAPGILEHPELRALLLPTLRADFAMVESYRYRPEPPLPVPVVVFAGADDPEAGACDMTGWSMHSSMSVRLHTLPGDHFFVHSSRRALLDLIEAELSALVRDPCCGRAVRAGELADDEVLVVEARLNDLPHLAVATGELSTAESRHAASLPDPVDAARFMARSVLLRRLLSGAGVDIGTADPPRAPDGVPDITHQLGLGFNTTQCAGLALFAFSRGREVGVDVARTVPVRNLETFISDGLREDERAALADTPEEDIPLEVLRIRVARGSVRNAIGDEARTGTGGFGFAGQHLGPWRAEPDPGLEHLAVWRVHHLELAGAVGAVALATDDWRLRYHVIRGAH